MASYVLCSCLGTDAAVLIGGAVPVPVNEPSGKPGCS